MDALLFDITAFGLNDQNDIATIDSLRELRGWSEPVFDPRAFLREIPNDFYERPVIIDNPILGPPNEAFSSDVRSTVRDSIELSKLWVQRYGALTRPLTVAILSLLSTNTILATLEHGLLPGASRLIDQLYIDPRLSTEQQEDLGSPLPGRLFDPDPRVELGEMQDQRKYLRDYPAVYIDLGRPYVGSSFDAWRRWLTHRSRSGGKKTKYYQGWSTVPHYFVVVLSFDPNDSIHDTLIRLIDQFPAHYDIKGWNGFPSDKKKSEVARAFAYFGEFTTMAALGNYCCSPLFLRFAKMNGLRLPSVIPVSQRYNMECGLEEWRTGAVDTDIQDNSGRTIRELLAPTGTERAITCNRWERGGRYRGNPLLILKFPARSQGTAPTLRLRLPIDLSGVVTEEELDRAVPQTSVFRLELGKLSAEGRPLPEEIKLYWTRKEWPTRPHGEPKTVILSLEHARVERCKCHGPVGLHRTWETNMHDLHAYVDYMIGTLSEEQRTSLGLD